MKYLREKNNNNQEVWEDEFAKEILEARKSTLPGNEDAAVTKQETWDVPLIEIDKTLVWSSNNYPLDRARLLAVSAPHAGDWLLSAPIASCGLGLSNEAIRVAILAYWPPPGPGPLCPTPMPMRRNN